MLSYKCGFQNRIANGKTPRLIRYTKPAEWSGPSPEQLWLFSSHLKSKLPFSAPIWAAVNCTWENIIVILQINAPRYVLYVLWHWIGNISKQAFKDLVVCGHWFNSCMIKRVYFTREIFLKWFPNARWCHCFSLSIMGKGGCLTENSTHDVICNRPVAKLLLSRRQNINEAHRFCFIVTEAVKRGIRE